MLIFQPPIYTSGNWTSPYAVSAPEFSNPIPRDNTDYLMKQDFVQLFEQYRIGTGAIALNTAHPTFAGFYFVGVTNLKDIGNGCVQWTRNYAKIPASYSEPSTMNYFFPGYLPGNSTHGLEDLRQPFNDAVVVYLQHDYFLIGADQTYTTLEAVPLLQTQGYYGQGGAAYPVRILGGNSIPSKDIYIQTIIGTLINVEGSTIEYWQGNIVVRKTPQIYAK